MDAHTPAATKQHLIKGEFAPVYWEPLGRRGERLVVGVLLTNELGIAQAHVTLKHKRLVEFISESKSESGTGVIQFAFDHFSKTLNAGGVIEDLKAPFASMSIGRTEAVSARDQAELWDRAVRLSTLIGHMAEPHATTTDPAHSAARTRGFLKRVREQIRMVDKKLALEAMKAKQFYPVGNSQMRLHFHLSRHYAQFCSLPLPTARAEAATECQARINDLVLIRTHNPKANVALCINTLTLGVPIKPGAKQNAAAIVQQRTLDYAKAMGIPTRQYNDPKQAATFLKEMAAER